MDQIKLVTKTYQNSLVDDLSDLDAIRNDLYETAVELEQCLTTGTLSKFDVKPLSTILLFNARQNLNQSTLDTAMI